MARAYASTRFGSARKRARDPNLVRRALARHAAALPLSRVLDVPAGAGRLRPALAELARRYVGVDVSASMLREGTREEAALLVGDARRLPFADATFDAVVCCRLLHHLRDPDAFRLVVGELMRVSRGLVVASFWDAGALPERHRLRPRRDRRRAHAKAFVRDAFARAGAEVLGFEHSFRFLTRQTFAVARSRNAPR